MNFMIGQKVGGGPSSIYIRSWRLKGPKKFEWMINLCGMKWIMFHGLLYNALGRGGLIARLGAMTINEVASGS